MGNRVVNFLNSAQQFIEENIDLIENEYWKSFWEKAVVTFTNDMIVRNIADILSQADIDTTTVRHLCLNEYIKDAVNKAFPKRSSKAIPMYNFIDNIPLNRRFGFNLGEIGFYITQKQGVFGLEVAILNGLRGEVYVRRKNP